mmetsp:Transcript_14979/g.29157  ORF Transcript_14979/g.29157 Transcript_14979/m.29157 type:complete len:115 (-) Transcript_14979:259-603(-)
MTTKVHVWMCSCMHADNLEAKQLSLETKFKGSSECKKSCGACLACLPVCLLAAPANRVELPSSDQEASQPALGAWAKPSSPRGFRQLASRTLLIWGINSPLCRMEWTSERRRSD